MTREIRGMKAGAAAVAVAVLCLLPAAPPARSAPATGAGGTGALEITVNVEGDGDFTGGMLYLGDRSIEFGRRGEVHRVEGLPPGRYAVTGDARVKGGLFKSDERYLGVADAGVAEGQSGKVSLTLQKVENVDEFCLGCHPHPSEGKPAGLIVRDLHFSGGDVGCESCHTLHLEKGNTSYVLAPFREGSDLCRGCHDAGHAKRTVGVEDCVNCHSLDASEAETGTSLISAASRTLPIMKMLSGGAAPETFGCTFCHNNKLNGEKMKDVLLHFGTSTSKHPVGFDFRRKADTKNEYLTSTATSLADELECTDCHDALLLVGRDRANQAGPAPYANHVDPESPGRAGKSSHGSRPRSRRLNCRKIRWTGSIAPSGR